MHRRHTNIEQDRHCCGTVARVAGIPSAQSTMHTALYRANALFTAAATALAVMAALAALTDVGLPASPGPISARVAAVEGLQVREKD
jgi:acid phosphatase family membrane protein YuiD